MSKNGPTDCGWCFSEMIPLRDTHPREEGLVGRLCTSCGRIYLDELERYDYTIRLDQEEDAERYWE